ncbi:YdiU family protein [Proteinivorax hydrogeniformans]|uniref:Protein nucleotidyltransferase YdiU n=1 Tax=Proteinivorax hydrogeniformans TaxID=1826727 RepID=A0AAU8HTE5_9FIRM
MTDKKSTTNRGWNLENSYVKLPNLFYTKVKPTIVRAPKLVIFNAKLAHFLGLDKKFTKEDYVDLFVGNKIPKEALPLAQAYAGHQFGHFTMLGDGRAILLGEQLTLAGKRYDIQLKGAGKTPYSRGGDGRATLGPMLREYIISEAMYALGIETTRSLAVVTTGETIIREKPLPGAILTRVAASHLRVGTFQYAANWGNNSDLRALADYTIARHFPDVTQGSNPYIGLLEEVVKRQALLIAKWQGVGFIHGVMNTDNVSICGETIDYGPCAFMDEYDPDTVFSSIDRQGRYAYENQPTIAAWNLARFAETLLPLLHDDKEQAIKIAEDAISDFTKLYHCNRINKMRAKLGIFNQEPDDESLIESLLSIMHSYGADYTNTFRALTFDRLEGVEIFDSKEFASWHQLWLNRLQRQNTSHSEVKQLMKDSNPGVIPRNHQVEEALEAAVEQEDYSVMDRLLKVLATPYAHSSQHEEYTKPPPPSKMPYRTFCGT